MGKYQRTANAVSSMTAVNFSEMKISSNPVETLVAFSIGSGIAMAIHDPVGGVGEYGQTIPGSSTWQGVDWDTLGYAAGILNDGGRLDGSQPVCGRRLGQTGPQ